jgi:PHD/YefM family antitoxin component YafN of YafNO toxin-antitoxin module
VVIEMEAIMSVTEARHNLLKLTKLLSEQMGRIVITNKGRSETILMSLAEYQSLKAAADLALHPEVLKSTMQGFHELQGGRGISLGEAFASPAKAEASASRKMLAVAG